MTREYAPNRLPTEILCFIAPAVSNDRNLKYITRVGRKAGLYHLRYLLKINKPSTYLRNIVNPSFQVVFLLLVLAVVCVSTSAEAELKIHEIIRGHENRKFGDHGGHEYGEGEKQASRKRYGYLPLNSELEEPVYYDAPPKYGLTPQNHVYRENVAAYAPKHHAKPQSHYAIVDPVTRNHQYVTFQELAEEPHYVAPDQKVLSQPHHPSHHHLDHHASGHYGDNSVHGESGHKVHKKHDISGHKSHSSSAGHHDEHDHHHNRAHYERDRGYHYEKAYAYDRVRAHHDVGSSKGAHSAHRALHSQEGHKDAGSHGYGHFHKHGRHGKVGHFGQGYEYLSPHQHAYGK